MSDKQVEVAFKLSKYWKTLGKRAAAGGLREPTRPQEVVTTRAEHKNTVRPSFFRRRVHAFSVCAGWFLLLEGDGG